MVFSHIKLIYKVIGCLLFFALMVGGATYMSIQTAAEVGATYDGIIHEDVVGLRDNLRANIDVNVIAILAYRHLFAETAGAMDATEKEIQSRSEDFARQIAERSPWCPHPSGRSSTRTLPGSRPSLPRLSSSKRRPVPETW